jgi:hypothetical protein
MDLIVNLKKQKVSLTRGNGNNLDYYPEYNEDGKIMTAGDKKLTKTNKPEDHGLKGSYGGVAGRYKSCYYNLRIRTEAEITDEKA